MTPRPASAWETVWGNTSLAVFCTGGDSALTTGTAAGLLSPEELARAARFHFREDRDRWMRSRALLRLCLAHTLQTDARALAFSEGPQGKPSLPAFPGCHFNLSHSGDYTALATGPEPVGIDIERIDTTVDVLPLAAHVFPPADVQALAARPQPHALFYRLWAIRESVMKCTGLGMSLPPDTIAVPNGFDGASAGAAFIENGDAFALCHPVLPVPYAFSAARYTAAGFPAFSAGKTRTHAPAAAPA